MNEKARYVIKRRIRIPQLKMREGEEYPVRFVEEWHDEPSRDEKKKGDVSIGKVIDLDTRELKTIVLNAVLKNLLSEEMPTYVGRCYLITCGELSDEDGGWRDMYLDEIIDPDEEANDEGEG